MNVVFILDDVQCFDYGSNVCVRVCRLEHKESDGGESSTKRTSKLQQQRRLLAKDLDSMYPWRQKMPTSTGMSFIQHADFNVDVSVCSAVSESGLETLSKTLTKRKERD